MVDSLDINTGLWRTVDLQITHRAGRNCRCDLDIWNTAVVQWQNHIKCNFVVEVQISSPRTA